MGPENNHVIFALTRSRGLTKRNCESGRHNRMRRKVSTLRPTSVHRKAHKIRKEERKTESLDPVLKVKTRTKGA